MKGRWTEEDDNTLRLSYPTGDLELLSKTLKRTKMSIWRRAKKQLKLKRVIKSPYLCKHCSENNPKMFYGYRLKTQCKECLKSNARERRNTIGFKLSRQKIESRKCYVRSDKYKAIAAAYRERNRERIKRQQQERMLLPGALSRYRLVKYSHYHMGVNSDHLTRKQAKALFFLKLFKMVQCGVLTKKEAQKLVRDFKEIPTEGLKRAFDELIIRTKQRRMK